MHHPQTTLRSHERQSGTAVVQRVGLMERMKRNIGMFLSGAGLVIIILTLSPFSPPLPSAGTIGQPTGNIINQVGYLGLGTIYLFAMLAMVNKRTLVHLLQPTWVIIFAIAFWSCTLSWDPAGSLRGVLLGAFAMIIVAGILVLAESEEDFVNAGATGILLLVLVNYAGVFFAPGVAVHSAFGVEPWHAGFWRGHLPHKNVAAPVFSVVCMFGIYCARSGATIRGILIAVLAANFVLHTGSKTTLGFLPIAIMIVMAGRAIGRPGLMVTAHALFTLLILGMTLGTVVSPTFFAMTKAVIEDATFTGRADIWKFGIEHLHDRLWLGHGYASFWLSPYMLGLEPNYEATWDVRGIVSGHNSYLDAVLLFGLPGGLTIITLIFIRPLFNYVKAFSRPQNRRLADFFVMVIIFMTYNGMLESFLLNRADPMWLTTALAVFGLSLISRMNLRQTP